MIQRYDAWALRRLLAGQPINGELQAVSEPFRRLAEHLASLHLEARHAALDGFLAGCNDSDAIIKALADVDPSGQPPEADADGDQEGDADGWGPLRLGTLPLAEPFPVDVLPEAAALLVVEGAEAIGCPQDFLAVPALAMAAGAIGRSASLLLKDGYFARGNVYAACVGPPSGGKTPALKIAAIAVRKIDEDLEAEYAQALVRWEEESARLGSDGKKQKPPPPPRPRRIDIDDATMETIPILLADNPRGLIMVRDELTAFMLGMNQFKGGKGNDRPIALKIWSGDAIKKDRVNHEANVPIRCPHPCLTIVGGLPPDMLGSLIDPMGRVDGFLDRFLLSYPEPLPVADWSERGIPDETIEEWRRLVARLWARPMDVKEGRTVPHVARFTPEGRAAWRKYYHAHWAEMHAPEFDPALRGPWGKLGEYAGRFALILACLHHAADPTANPVAVLEVGPETVARAWRLVDYFKNHSERVHSAIAIGSGIGGGRVVKAIVDWLRQGRRESFSEHDIKQARRWIEPEELTRALAYLTKRNVVRPREAPPETSKSGRPLSPAYDVNPLLLDAQNPQNTRNPVPTGGDEPPFEDFESFEVRGARK
jgi:hypothetical protein